MGRGAVVIIACALAACGGEGGRDPLFAPDRLLEVAIELAPADWERVRRERRDEAAVLAGDCLSRPFARPFSWARGRVTVLGRTLEAVGVRKKGFLGSLDPDKPSLKLKLDRHRSGQRLFGAREMTLNNAIQDPSLIRQCLAYRVFAAAGIAAPRCNFARVRVNGADLGVYVHVEAIDERFLAARFAGDGGLLVEGTLSDVRPGWLGTFETKVGSDAAAQRHLAAVAAALARPTDELVAALAAEIDIDAFLRFWAVEVLVGHRDGYAGNANNFFLHRDPAAGRWRFLPWGTDSSFKDGGGAVYAAGALAHRLAGVPAMRRRYAAALERLLDEVWDERWLAGEIRRMEALLEPALAPDEWRRVRLAVSGVRAFVHTRRRVLLAELAGGLSGAAEAPPLRAYPCLATAARRGGR
jgi:hypothetical protein